MTRAVVFLVMAAAAWAFSYASGAFPWLGYASLSRTSIAAGPVSIVGSSTAGTEFGPTTFLFFEGQEIVIEYEAEVRAGSLWFHVFRPFDGELGDGVSHYVTETGAGTWSVIVPMTDVYTISIDASPVKGPRRGYDISYDVKWGARPRAGGQDAR